MKPEVGLHRTNNRDLRGCMLCGLVFYLNSWSALANVRVRRIARPNGRSKHTAGKEIMSVYLVIYCENCDLVSATLLDDGRLPMITCRY